MRFQTIISAALAPLLLTALHAELPSEEVILKKGGPDAAMIIEKARDILATSQVFASRGIGEGGTPTSSCWALTVIVRYDPIAKDFLNLLFDSAEFPEQRLYAIAGLITLDPTNKKRFAPEKIQPFADQLVYTQFGCTGAASRFGMETILLLTEDTAPYYLFKKLPSLYSTQSVLRPSETSK